MDMKPGLGKMAVQLDIVAGFIKYGPQLITFLLLLLLYDISPLKVM